MSGLRELPLTLAYRRLHAAGVTTTSLAAEVCTSRAYVSRVLTGHERHGPTWERIRRVIARQAPGALELLEQVAPKPRQPTAVRRTMPAGDEVAPVAAAASAAAVETFARPMARAFATWRNQQRQAV